MVNKTWTTTSGDPASGIEWSASVTDSDGNIYTTGHNVNASFIVELLLMKQSRNGEVIWQEAFDLGAGTKTYGIGLALDNDSLYVAGATYNASNGDLHDYLILKYDTTGTQDWYTIYNSTSDSEDVPSKIITDGSGNTFLTGASYDSTSNYDYLTLKVSPSGTVLWNKRYDYNDLREGAAALEIDVSGDVVVTGGSESTANQWDYATLKYDPSDGSVLQEKRVSSGSFDLDTPLGFTSDDNGNFYITGYGNSDNDIYTLKLDTDLEIVWESYFGDSSLVDQGTDVEVDENGHVFVSGFTGKTNGGSDYILLKYDDDGNEIWYRKRSARTETEEAKAYFLEFDSQGNLVVTGEEQSGTNSYLKTLLFDDEGKLLWEDIHDGNSSEIEKPTGLIVDDEGEIIVTSYIKKNPTGDYQTVKYVPFYHDITYDLGPDSVPTNINGTVIIRFNPLVVDSSFADNPDLTYGTVAEIITDQQLILDMDSIFDAKGPSHGTP